MTSVRGEPLSNITGRYSIERELGRGGMATVYVATDTAVGRRVAMKVLRPDLAAAVGAERFHREIRIASTLAHPNILPVYDSGERDGTLFYVMPLVEGESLRHLLSRQRQLSCEEAIRITCEVASALDYAHAHGIMHRDIKPENILLESGHAVVADFGIARAVGSIGDMPALTQTGVSLGTPAYMSPEQSLADKAMDGRSDQYALGCVAYEMLAGEPPFTASSTQALVARHLTTPVPLITTIRPAVSEGLQDVILRALEKAPADRFPTMADFASALCGAEAQVGATNRRLSGVRTVPGTRASRATVAARDRARITRRRGAIFVVASLAVGAVGLALALRWRPAHEAVAAGSVDDKRVAVLYFDDLSPDKRLGYLADGLTEELIDRLRDVQSLDVVSRDGVAPLRRAAVPLDSAARALKVGTIVTGTVDADGPSVRIGLRLLDAASGADFRRASFTVPQAAVLTARDSVAAEASRMLRDYFREEIRLRRMREHPGDAKAWTLVQMAERFRKEAEERAGEDSTAAARLAGSADSLLALAEARDASWSQPSILRARVALGRAKASDARASTAQWIEKGLGHVERALRTDPRSAAALELRGALRFERYVRGPASPAEEKSLLQAAQTDLLRATEIDPGQANAWNVLSALDYRNSDVVSANLHARRALEADFHLAAADSVLWRLFSSAYDVGHLDEAVKWCSEGHRRFPASDRFVECRLWIGVLNKDKPDVAEAWRATAEYVERVPPARRPLAERQARLLVVAPLVYAGLSDSARRVLNAARVDRDAGAGVDGQGSLAIPHALALTRLGERDAAMRVLKKYLPSHPPLRAEVRNNMWWLKDLHGDPEFRALVGTR